MNNSQQQCKTVVLISGYGSNLQALIDYLPQAPELSIVAVISNISDAYGLIRASNANIPAIAINHKDFPDRESFEQQLLISINEYQPDLILLAGFMRILTPSFVANFQGKMLNIHPSLLPDYKGLNTHQRVLADKQKYHGVSIHLVTPELDGGPIIAQVKVNVLEDDDVESLQKRVQAAEYQLYPKVARWFAQKRLKFSDNVVILDDKLLPATGKQVSL